MRTITPMQFFAWVVAAMLTVFIPQRAQADLLYTHYLHGEDGGFGLFQAPPFEVLPATFEFFIGTSGGAASTGTRSLQVGANVVDFSGDLLQTMRTKAADGIIDPNNPDDFWGLLVTLSGNPAGNYGRDAEQEALDIQNPDTPQQTSYDPAYLAALTGADIQAVRLTVTVTCFSGTDVLNECEDFIGWSGVQGFAQIEFFGERRNPIPEPAALPLTALALLLSIAGIRRVR